MVPKWIRNPPKIHSICLVKDSCKPFSIDFVTLSGGFQRRPTLNPTTIYSTFVGSGLFRRVRKGNQNDHPNSFKIESETIAKPSKNQSQNEASNMTKKTYKSSSHCSPFGLPFGTLGLPFATLGLALGTLRFTFHSVLPSFGSLSLPPAHFFDFFTYLR